MYPCLRSLFTQLNVEANLRWQMTALFIQSRNTIARHWRLLQEKIWLVIIRIHKTFDIANKK